MERDRAIELHREMWRKISDTLINNTIKILNAKELKRAIIEKYFPDYVEISSNCFLCEYSAEHTTYDNLLYRCKCCPLAENSDTSNCLDGLYGKFLYAMREGLIFPAHKIALQIAELPIVKED